MFCFTNYLSLERSAMFDTKATVFCVFRYFYFVSGIFSFAVWNVANEKMTFSIEVYFFFELLVFHMFTAKLQLKNGLINFDNFH